MSREGQGKSGGYRTIIIIQHKKIAFFVYGFTKSFKDNLKNDEEIAFKKMSDVLFSLSNDDLEKLLIKGDFIEVKNND
tara:strand:+ start:519 stop:752 length:234 start_codon:yes stop_codon:yes gene_type:complete